MSRNLTIPYIVAGNTAARKSQRAWWLLASGKIAIGFVTWSVCWVVLSDLILHGIVRNSQSVIWTLETVKGLVYVAVTAILLFRFAKARETECYAARHTTETRLRRLTESNLISVCYWKRTGEITDANDSFLKLLGYQRQELLDHKVNWHDFIPPECETTDSETLRRLVAGGLHISYERELIRKDRCRVPVLIGAASLGSNPYRGIAYFIDITVLKEAQQKNRELEEQLRQSQKLEAVGQLASGIAHDFNNLLNIIVGYTHLIRVGAKSDQSLVEQATHISRAAAKAAILVKKLLAFGRKQVFNLELVDLNAVLAEYQQIVPRLIGENIRFHLQLAPELWLVKVDRNQFEQVVMNLAINARDAMPHGGSLTITTGNSIDTDQVFLSVADSGIGMDEKTKQKIFEPFFTTKPQGQGTGLGLATVHGIVGQSGGEISVSSEPGLGTTFVVSLPRAKEVQLPRVMGEIKEFKEYAQPAPISSVGHETILLAEDEGELRELQVNLLKMHGYNVLPATDGESAVAMASSYKKQIQLFLTDITMPKMSGIDAAERIVELRPDIRVIYMTGYAENTIHSSKAMNRNLLLEKPISPQLLLSKIRLMLDAGQVNTQKQSA